MEGDRFWLTQIHVMSTHVQQESVPEMAPNKGEENKAPHVTLAPGRSPNETCQTLSDNSLRLGRFKNSKVLIWGFP